jgi:gamma-glutamyltranspeptidase/glutathione hydrolase
LDPQSVLDRPRICIPGGNPDERVAVEAGIPPETLSQLAEWGHAVESIEGYSRAIFGRGQILLRDPKTGVISGGSDPRADGCAVGLL